MQIIESSKSKILPVKTSASTIKSDKNNTKLYESTQEKSTNVNVKLTNFRGTPKTTTIPSTQKTQSIFAKKPNSNSVFENNKVITSNNFPIKTESKLNIVRIVPIKHRPSLTEQRVKFEPVKVPSRNLSPAYSKSTLQPRPIINHINPKVDLKETILLTKNSLLSSKARLNAISENSPFSSKKLFLKTDDPVSNLKISQAQDWSNGSINFDQLTGRKITSSLLASDSVILRHIRDRSSSGLKQNYPLKIISFAEKMLLFLNGSSQKLLREGFRSIKTNTINLRTVHELNLIHAFQNEFELPKKHPDFFDSNQLGFSDIPKRLFESYDRSLENSLFQETNLQIQSHGNSAIDIQNGQRKLTFSEPNSILESGSPVMRSIVFPEKPPALDDPVDLEMNYRNWKEIEEDIPSSKKIRTQMVFADQFDSNLTDNNPPTPAFTSNIGSNNPKMFERFILSDQFSNIPETNSSKYVSSKPDHLESVPRDDTDGDAHKDFFLFNRLSQVEARPIELDLKSTKDQGIIFNKDNLVIKQLHNNFINGYFYYNPKDTHNKTHISVLEKSTDKLSNSQKSVRINQQGFSMFSLFDGQEASHCSQFVNSVFNDTFAKTVEIQGNFSGSVKKLYQDIDRRFEVEFSGKSQALNSGSCAFSLLVLNSSLVSINLGNSKCIVSKNLCREITELNEVHSPEKIGELDRILSLGGSLTRTKKHRGGGPSSQQVVRNYFDLKQLQKKEKEEKNFEFGDWKLNDRYQVSRMLGFPAENKGSLSILNKEPQISDCDVEENDFAFIASLLIS